MPSPLVLPSQCDGSRRPQVKGWRVPLFLGEYLCCCLVLIKEEIIELTELKGRADLSASFCFSSIQIQRDNSHFIHILGSSRSINDYGLSLMPPLEESCSTNAVQSMSGHHKQIHQHWTLRYIEFISIRGSILKRCPGLLKWFRDPSFPSQLIPRFTFIWQEILSSLQK